MKKIKNLVREILRRIISIYNIYLNQSNISKIEKYVFSFAVIAFLIHGFTIFINRQLSEPFWVFGRFEDNYLSAISTPFSIILFFEIFVLAVSTPKTMSKSIALQYEIVSLVFLRNVFKDISNLSSISDVSGQVEVFRNLTLDVGGSMAMFLLIGIFYFVTRLFGSEKNRLDRQIIRIKKLFSLGLIIIFFGLGLTYVLMWTNDLLNFNIMSQDIYIDEFFEKFFLVMIFSDIILVLISFIIRDQYSTIFRDATLIISVIFIRLSFTIDKPYDIITAIISVIIGILISTIYLLHKKYHSLTKFD